MSPKLSIIIPTYNERGSIVSLIDKITDTLRTSLLADTEVEIIIVDDDSPDGTGKLCQSLADEYPAIKVMLRTGEKGLAHAIKQGIIESKGDILVIMDADLSHDPVLIPTLVSEITSDAADIGVASRFADDGKMISTLHHVWGSKALNTFIRTILRIPIKDVTGGFLAIRKDALKNLDLDTIFKGYGDYCFALLYEGSKQGWRTKEIGFTYRRRESGLSKTRFFAAGFSYAIRALRLRVGLD